MNGQTEVIEQRIGARVIANLALSARSSSFSGALQIFVDFPHAQVRTQKL